MAPLSVDPNCGAQNNNPRDARVDEDILEQDATLPIAVIGYSLRFPQGAVSSEAFWQMLIEGRSARTEIPSERFNIDAFHHPDINRHDKLNVRHGHFLQDEPSTFDAPFFSITPPEAATMDPQQRGLLETTYRAFENSGIPLARAAGSRTSVHVGSFSHDWNKIITADPLMGREYEATGSEFSILANRLSWFYDLVGPSIALDTACSSSLMALHLACQCLRNRESDMGVVGGANVILHPESMISMANIGLISPDGKSYSFDQRANGYGRGEGFGVVIIKRLAEALRDGDTIRAVIRATGSNQDGRTLSITQPNGNAQTKLIRETYEGAGLDLKSTRYFEAHGGGTQIGDRTEAKAIAAAFKSQRSNEEPLYVGAVKTNIGHLEGASGLAGLIKTILILERGTIPPNIWLETTNIHISEREGNIKFPTVNVSWPSSGLRRASINSFGFGGSNVHAVLDDASNYLSLRGLKGRHCTSESPRSENENTEDVTEFTLQDTYPDGTDQGLQPMLFVWSTADEDGMKRFSSLYAAYLSSLAVVSGASTFLRDLAYTLFYKRSSLPWKSFAIASSVDQLCQILGNDLTSPILSTTSKNMGFVFTGQGAQWHAMGRELMRYSTFKESLSASQDKLLSIGCKWALLDELFKLEHSTKIDQAGYSQPICTALQIALVDMLQSWSIRPSAVVGHSSGEIAAAYCIGALCRESALKVAFFRGQVAAKLSATHTEQGAMLSVGLSEPEIKPYLTIFATTHDNCSIAVACINSPQNVTLSGSESQIQDLKAILDLNKVATRRLKVDIAYHSEAMEEITSEYTNLIGDLSPREPMPNCPTMVSSLTGKKIAMNELTHAGYWAQNIKSQVKFSEALSELCSLSSGTRRGSEAPSADEFTISDLLEIGPHSALQVPIKEILGASQHGSEISYNSILIRGVSAVTSSISAVGQLHCLGYDLNLNAVNNPIAVSMCYRMLTGLPEYPFRRDQQYWTESRVSKNYRFRKYPRHELLGTPVPDWSPLNAKWRYHIRRRETPWIMDHKVNGLVVFPGAGLLVMAIEAARQTASSPNAIVGYKLTNVVFTKALLCVSNADDIETEIHLRPLKSNDEKVSKSNEFRICTHVDGQWAENCCGIIATELQAKDVEVDGGKEDREEILRFKSLYEIGFKSCRAAINSKQLYERFSKIGLSYGPTFQVLSDVCYNHSDAIGKVMLRDWTANVDESLYQDHVIHPTALDGLLQLALPAIVGIEGKSLTTLVPARISSLWVSSRGLSGPGNDSIRALAKCNGDSSETTTCFILGLDNVFDDPLVVIKGLQTRGIESKKLVSSANGVGAAPLCYSLDWLFDLEVLSKQEIVDLCHLQAPSEKSPTDFFNDAEFMCFSTISNTLEYLAGKDMTNIKPHLRRYVEWMKRQISRYNSRDLIHWQPEWSTLRHNHEYNEKVISRVGNFSAEGRLYAETAKNLRPIIDGEVDTLDFLFSGGLAIDAYKEAGRRAIGAIEPYLDSLAHQEPGVRILEVGAGTGATTMFVLQTLARHGEVPRYGRYTFTDISPGFFEKAKIQFIDYADRMEYKVLNIEIDPVQQGFLAGEYDIVVAVNVLHATTNLNVCLQNTRKLLRDGGTLILCELYDQAVIRTGFAFGIIPGWWLSTEENRQWSPLLSRSGWQNALNENGFSGIDAVFPEYTDVPNALTNTMLSTAKDESHTPILLPRMELIVNESSELQKAIGHHVKVQLSSLGVPKCEIIDLSKVSSPGLEQRFLISLLEIGEPFFLGISDLNYKRFQSLVKSKPGLLWVTDGGGQNPARPEADMITGLSRCLRSENDNLRLITLALGNTTCVEGVALHITNIIRTTFRKSPEQCEAEYEERNGRLYIPRIKPANQLNDHLRLEDISEKPQRREFGCEVRALKLNVSSPGLLDTMEYIEDLESNKPLAPDEVEVKVKAIGVNFKDVLIALGRLSEGGLGNECAGIVTRAGSETDIVPGDRVCVATFEAYKTYVRSKATTVFKISEKISYVEAAALPVVYSTAYHALYEIARLRKSESVLIHSGAGGTGQAAIQLAKLRNSTIFVTVGLEKKKKLLMDLYAIPEDHIFSSRGMSFVKGIHRMTKGRGVDVILNSLAGESLHGSWECLAPFGRFVEIGKNDILQGNKLSMFPFNENRMFAAVNLTHMMKERPTTIKHMMESILALVEEKKITTPQPLHVFSISKTEEAFRYIQGGQNTGKTILELNDDDGVSVIHSPRPTYSFAGDKTYIIAGGLGGLGKCIARWMVRRGAKHLILLSRSGAEEKSADFLNEIQAKGANVATPTCDISDEKSLSSVLAKYAYGMPQIKGCIQSTMVLKDAIFEKMSLAEFNSAIKPKVNGSWNLHKCLPQNLEFFIMLSSTCGITGVRGQANYASGNTFQDSLARHRLTKNQKAISLDLGWIASSGYVAERPHVAEAMRKLAYPPLSEEELLSLLDYHCDPNLPLASPSDCQVITGMDTPARLKAQNIEEPYWMRRSMFRAMHQIGNISSPITPDGTTYAPTEYAALLSHAKSVAEAAKIIEDGLVKKLSRTLSVPEEEIDESQTMHMMGVDSLVAVEIRNWFAKEIGADLLIFEILGNESVADLSYGIAARSQFG